MREYKRKLCRAIGFRSQSRDSLLVIITLPLSCSSPLSTNVIYCIRTSIVLYVRTVCVSWRRSVSVSKSTFRFPDEKPSFPFSMQFLHYSMYFLIMQDLLPLTTASGVIGLIMNASVRYVILIPSWLIINWFVFGNCTRPLIVHAANRVERDKERMCVRPQLIPPTP